jgi:hypothetical protein
MNFKLFCIYSLFIYNIILHSLVENSNIKIPDFRWIKTTCIAGYNSWSYGDVNASTYMKSKKCWVFQNNIQFSQPYLPYEFIVFLDVFVFSIGLLLF